MNTIKQKEFIKAFVFNLRWGQLLERERSRVGVSRETLATAFGLDPLEVGRWETGFGSPIASVFYKIIVFLGPEAYRSAAGLWPCIACGWNGGLAISRLARSATGTKNWPRSRLSRLRVGSSIAAVPGKRWGSTGRWPPRS